MPTITHKWQARSPVDGKPVQMRRLQFGNQAEQIELLRKMITAYRSTHGISALARDIVFRIYQRQPKQRVSQAVAIAEWVQANITYCNEGEETFQTPLATLRFGYGDCDDFATLICSLVESLGIPCQLVAVAWADPVELFGRRVAGPWAKVFGHETYRHIFARAVVPAAGGRVHLVPLDATLNDPVLWLTDPVKMAQDRGVHPRTLVL